MKIYNKKDCAFVNGYIDCDNEVVSVPSIVVAQANKLEDDVQRAEYDKANKVEPVNTKPFVRKSSRPTAVIEVDTPILDQKVEAAKQLIEELDAVATCDGANDYLKDLAELIDFAASETIVEGTPSMFGGVRRFDLPVIGNPLELTVDKIVEFALEVFDE